jgi:hypothetical protein
MSAAAASIPRVRPALRSAAAILLTDNLKAAASLAAWSLLSATTPAPKRSLPPLAAESDYDRNDPVFLDMDKVRF